MGGVVLSSEIASEATSMKDNGSELDSEFHGDWAAEAAGLFADPRFLNCPGYRAMCHGTLVSLVESMRSKGVGG